MRGAWFANLAIGMIWLMALGKPAWAEPTKPTEAEIEAARAHFEDAEKAKARGDFRAAATAYVDAYEILPDAEFLFNAGEMYRLAGDTDDAIRYFERYLEIDPDGRGADEAQASLEKLKATREPVKEEPPEITEKNAGHETTAPLLTTTPEVDADDHGGGRTLRIAGLATAGTGLALVGAGVYFGLKAKSLSDEVSGADSYLKDKVAEGESAEAWQVATLSVGAAAIIGGGVLYYLGMRADGDKEHPTQVAAWTTPTVVGLQVGGSF